ncbi:glycosyltransferase family 2 protein [Parvularcula dongshanensis]|uniref:GT2 family glycosyltransferase n=1 Tax=Parvularcula dongshanensis TaxID=1173995 RepID=A0A840I3M4_9PROT|nr:glycosyltransferase [Parvularcula dongshanensis]MBB4658925.1 GT2 family glycosyltransferase [Parvularcula dongshanensis]
MTNAEPVEGQGGGALSLRIGVVVIGRNEGERLVRCLASLPPRLPAVYVDSGSTDESVEAARRAGLFVHSLDMSRPFSAGRARNEGFALLAREAKVDAVQFLDGDTVLQPGWLPHATRFLADHADTVAVAGRRREVRPESSWYNTLCDLEWDTPVGEADAVGGDALYRAAAFSAAGGFDPNVIAGEEPELCLRLRRAGGRVHRLDAEMTLHDAAIYSFGPWWRHAVRAGYAWTLGALMHWREGHYVKELARTIVWGAGLPILALLALAVGFWPVALLVVALYAAKWLRLAKRFSGRVPKPPRYAAFLMLSNVAETFGAARCLWETAMGRRTIVEYK